MKTAMDMAGIRSDEPVEFIGHSQGGIIAAQLASESDIRARYSVASVLTAGSPVAGFHPDPGVPMLNMEIHAISFLPLMVRQIRIGEMHSPCILIANTWM